jgi:hypothetical protein
MKKYIIKWAAKEIPNKHDHAHVFMTCEDEIVAKSIVEENNRMSEDIHYWYEEIHL